MLLRSIKSTVRKKNKTQQNLFRLSCEQVILPLLLQSHQRFLLYFKSFSLQNAQNKTSTEGDAEDASAAQSL